MDRKKRRFYTLMLTAAVCCVMAMGGCASGGQAKSGKETGENVQEEDAQGNAGAAGDDSQADAAGEDSQGNADVSGEGISLGEFTMQDVQGQAYTQEMFADYDLTMVNVFATWCSPCINEIPDLQKLSEEMKDKGVNVVGIVLDAVDASGNVDQEAVETAKVLADLTGVSYPFLIPDAGYLNGRLIGISAVPETFFVDKNGNIVGETYSGSRSFDDWKKVVETELEGAVQ